VVDFLRRVPLRSGGTAEVVVHEMVGLASMLGRCAGWVRLVQPHVVADERRADRHWDWQVEIPFTVAAFGWRRRPRMFQMCRRDDDFPLGMVALLEEERRIVNHDLPAVFVWYATAAPEAAFPGHDTPVNLMTSTMDIAVTVALNGRAGGHLWLHADPAGGDRLVSWYVSKNFDSVPRWVTLPQPSVGFRRNDGRYYLLTPEGALRRSQALERFRS
jgi:hypothetical protein